MDEQGNVDWIGIDQSPDYLGFDEEDYQDEE